MQRPGSRVRQLPPMRGIVRIGTSSTTIPSTVVPVTSAGTPVGLLMSITRSATGTPLGLLMSITK